MVSPGQLDWDTEDVVYTVGVGGTAGIGPVDDID